MQAETGMVPGIRSPELDGDLVVAERALSGLTEAWEAAIDEAGSTVPPLQLRAVLALAAAPLSVTALAGRLRASVSATSRLCDRLQHAGLVSRDHTVPGTRGVDLSLTPAGVRLSAWVHEQRRDSLAAIMAGMTPAARRALTGFLGEMPASAVGGLRPDQEGSRGARRAAVHSPERMDVPMTSEWTHDPAGLLATTDGSVGRSLGALARAVTDHVPSCCGASATLWEPDQVVAMGASNADLAAVAEHQFLAGDGPIIAALRSGEPAVTPDTLLEERWPEFVVAALAAGVRSQATVVHQYSLMTLSLSLYGAAPGTFDDDKLSPAELLAELGLAAMAGAAEEGRVQRTPEQLDAAIRSRAEVEQARDFVMQKLDCGPDEAFERLWRIAQQQRRRVAEVARRIVTACEDPEDPGATTW